MKYVDSNIIYIKLTQNMLVINFVNAFIMHQRNQSNNITGNGCGIVTERWKRGERAENKRKLIKREIRVKIHMLQKKLRETKSLDDGRSKS